MMRWIWPKSKPSTSPGTSSDSILLPGVVTLCLADGWIRCEQLKNING
ncbi:unnamed protein product [Brassica napus]|uniref:(rape) hypothetical protein n=1 Tax=Brassica napus TaxID=3708 RepID=A0A817APW6_BRANA|nr:unnamed protein product [Brassica napus]